MITIARHLLIDQRRAAKTHPVEADLDEAFPDHAESIESMLVEDEQLNQVLSSIQRLPFPQGDILSLRYVLGWQVKAIATHLELPENTVSVYLRRGLARVQAQLVPHEIVNGSKPQNGHEKNIS